MSATTPRGACCTRRVSALASRQDTETIPSSFLRCPDEIFVCRWIREFAARGESLVRSGRQARREIKRPAKSRCPSAHTFQGFARLVIPVLFQQLFFIKIFLNCHVANRQVTQGQIYSEFQMPLRKCGRERQIHAPLGELQPFNVAGLQPGMRPRLYCPRCFLAPGLSCCLAGGGGFKRGVFSQLRPREARTRRSGGAAGSAFALSLVSFGRI